MKKLLILVFVIISQMGYSQDISKYFKDIAKSDISVISNKFSSSMEVCVNDSQDFMSKDEAITAIKGFLEKVKPVSGSQLHTGTSKSEGSQYRLGKLKTEKGNYRVFIYLEGPADDYEIVGILFNPE